MGHSRCLGPLGNDDAGRDPCSKMSDGHDDARRWKRMEKLRRTDAPAASTASTTADDAVSAEVTRAMRGSYDLCGEGGGGRADGPVLLRPARQGIKETSERRERRERRARAPQRSLLLAREEAHRDAQAQRMLS